MFQIWKRKINISEKEDVENGVFVIDGQINNSLAYNVIKDMLAYSERCPKETITLYLNCEGGSVSAGMAIYDTMRFLPNQVKTIATGKVIGMAVLLLAAGTLGMRFAYSDTQIVLGQFLGKADTPQQNETIDSAIEKVYHAFGQHTGRTVEEWKEVSVSQVSMKPKEARKFGVIDKVL